MIGDLAENLSGIRVIQAFANEETSSEKFDDRQWREPRRPCRGDVAILCFLADG